ncbi:MAG: TraR/DksA family transcriptional regulator [Myxococcota bacterium]
MATKKKSTKADSGPEPQAHPDSKLTKKQVRSLYDALVAKRAHVAAGLGEHLSVAISDIDPLSDEMDVAQRHTEQATLMRRADKERKLLVQIENALEKMEEGEYGVCEGTGEPIGLKRLEARPWTRYSVEYKEQVERERKQYQR